MRIAIMQPYFLPYIGYWQLMDVADIFVYYDDISFIKQGWINRNRILMQGKAHLFTLQIIGSSSFKRINEILLGGNRSKIYKTFLQAYSKAAYFIEMAPLLERIFKSDIKNLSEYIIKSNKILIEKLGITCQFMKSSEIDISPELKGQERVIAICRELKASHYINPIGGWDLYSKDAFLGSGIELEFLKSVLKPYVQKSYTFVPGLSIVDAMMHIGVCNTVCMLADYEILKK
jgi:hypothetical protein